MSSLLFSPLSLRSVTLRNRIAVSPMCQYSYEDGFSNDWQFVHLGSRAVGGAGLVIVEATAVVPEGRISPQDLGLWKDEHIAPLARLARFVSEQGSVPGIQIAHAGRKASTAVPWKGDGAVSPSAGGWKPVGPTAEPFSDTYPVPQALDKAGIDRVLRAFADTAVRAHTAGFRLLELHSAHGYLFHEFLSPLVNKRTDEYGGTFENRIRIVREAARAVRAKWPDELPLIVRISATDWVEEGWTVEDSVALARLLKEDGVDLMDCSSGRRGALREDPRRPWLPDIAGRAGPPRGGHSHRHRGNDHLRLPGRAHPAHGTGGPRHPRTRAAARPVLAPARRQGAGRR
ncbi:NADH:flavin oxidoreductase/nadh oxidase, partial [Stigmatella aurantiaca DW4/3-1]